MCPRVGKVGCEGFYTSRQGKGRLLSFVQAGHVDIVSSSRPQRLMNGAFDSATEVTVVWLWLWNFIESAEINNRFLHPNEQPLAFKGSFYIL